MQLNQFIFANKNQTLCNKIKVLCRIHPLDFQLNLLLSHPVCCSLHLSVCLSVCLYCNNSLLTKKIFSTCASSFHNSLANFVPFNLLYLCFYIELCLLQVGSVSLFSIVCLLTNRNDNCTCLSFLRLSVYLCLSVIV